MPARSRPFIYRFGQRTTNLINYTSRDYNSIRNDLTVYARTYYTNTLRDFTENSFGALLLDSVAYIGDQLSFYLDYNVNEAFLDTASQKNNIIRLAKNSGYKYKGRGSAYGTVALYVIVPSNNSGTGPDPNYLKFTIKRGTRFRARGAGSSYLLMDNVRFDRAYSDAVVARVDESTGVPTAFALKSYGRVVSGRLAIKTIRVRDYEKFRKLSFRSSGLAEILSVHDDEGNRYYEVDYLTQNVIFQEVTNPNSNEDSISSIMKPVTVPRRFTLERRNAEVILQFGYGGGPERGRVSVADPRSILLDIYGKDYISDVSFDPSRLLGTDKFGLAPQNTNLHIKYRTQDPASANASPGIVRTIAELEVEFDDPTLLNRNTMMEVKSSIEVFNDSAIMGDVSGITAEEVRHRALGAFPTQNRAVTRQDYESIAYGMHPKFGRIKRCAIYQDPNSLKRNLNMYVLAADDRGYFTTANDTLKRNLKTWLMQYKMINDTIDILDGKVVNFGITFKVKIMPGSDRSSAMTRVYNRLRSHFSRVYHFGEHMSISSVYKIINTTPGVMDCLRVDVVQKAGAPYSTIKFDFERNISADGTYLSVPKNVVLELRYPKADIRGSAV